MNYDQLTAITRRQDRVFKAKDFKALESIEFVKNVSTTACAAGRDIIIITHSILKLSWEHRCGGAKPALLF